MMNPSRVLLKVRSSNLRRITHRATTAPTSLIIASAIFADREVLRPLSHEQVLALVELVPLRIFFLPLTIWLVETRLSYYHWTDFLWDDISNLFDNFYLNFVDWSQQNVIDVALRQTVFIWNVNTSNVIQFVDLGDKYRCCKFNID